MTTQTDAIKLAIEALERNKRGLKNIELFGKSNVKFSGLTEMIEKTDAALAALQEQAREQTGCISNCETCTYHHQSPAHAGHCYMFFEEPQGICGQWKDYAAPVQAREGEAVVPSAILARGRFHFFKGEDGEPDDWEWFEEGTNCEQGCIDAVIVRADAIAAPQPAQPTLKWCDQCGEGVTDFCRGKGGKCAYGFKPAGQPAQPVALPLTPEELDLCRQWFNSIQDVNGGYLTPLDYVLAEKLYKQLNMRVPNSISEITKSGIGGAL